MKFHQEAVAAISFSLASIIVLNCVPSTMAWKEQDGMTIEVPKRMAKLLNRITKHQLNSVRKIIKNGQELIPNLKDKKDLEAAFDLSSLTDEMHVRNRIGETKDIMADLRSADSDESGRRRLQKRTAFPLKPKISKVCNGAKVYVNLTKYSNIVSPPGFTTIYCGQWYPMPIGNHPVRKIVSRAILETFNQMSNFSTSVFRNAHCCVPSKIRSLQVLYNDPKKDYSMIKYIHKVVVRSCGCYS